MKNSDKPKSHGNSKGPRKGRVAREAVVVQRTRLSPSMLRLTLRCEQLIGTELPYTDHYIKLLFVPEGADYQWPFQPGEIRDSRPREMWPVTRTYTIRSFDPATGDMEVDFVLHGDTGLAGPWAAGAQPGDVIGFAGPGGAWAPGEEYDAFVFAGDESAAPAIAAGLGHVPNGARAVAFIEVEDAAHEFDLVSAQAAAHAEIHWVHREGATPGTELMRAVREGGVPEGRVSWFVHGVAEMVKDVRRFLFVENHVEKADASISGYWRIGMTENEWQASKREFVASMEADEAEAATSGR